MALEKIVNVRYIQDIALKQEAVKFIIKIFVRVILYSDLIAKCMKIVVNKCLQVIWCKTLKQCDEMLWRFCCKRQISKNRNDLHGLKKIIFFHNSMPIAQKCETFQVQTESCWVTELYRWTLVSMWTILQIYVHENYWALFYKKKYFSL